jgi:hypothetical protein
MTSAYPQWPGFRLPFPGRHHDPPQVPAALPLAGAEASAVAVEVPDHHSQLEDLLGHVRRCERWARLDDRIDLSWRLGGNR